jgi:hypothetical protein
MRGGGLAAVAAVLCVVGCGSAETVYRCRCVITCEEATTVDTVGDVCAARCDEGLDEALQAALDSCYPRRPCVRPLAFNVSCSSEPGDACWGTR